LTHGLGVTRDLSEAVRWLKQSAEDGYYLAQHDLGVSYLQGKGVKRDEKAAFAWFMKSAEQGFADAQWAVADCYFDGKGVRRNYKKAVEWSLKASEQRFAQSYRTLGQCYARGLGVKKDAVEAYKWFILYEVEDSRWAKTARNELENRENMTPEQIAEAKRRAENFLRAVQPSDEAAKKVGPALER
jgi:uncharacterized protein